VDGRPTRRDEILAAAAGLFADGGYRTTSMREVAAAAGILAGSLYHHFPSKEAIAIELVERYHADLVRAVRDSGVGGSGTGGSGTGGPGSAGRDPVAALRSFARDVAEVSHRHRAALKITMYDAPATAGSGLKTVVHAQPASLDRHWRMLISAAVGAGAIDPDLDTRVLRHVLRATTLQVGVMTWERGAPAGGPQAVADCATSILFDGLAAPPPGSPGPALSNRSAPPETGESVAARVVGAARTRWADEAADGRRQRRGMILDTARTLFARRGFEATTVRDIADGAGLQAGNLYRYFPSKDAMAAEILSGFSDRLLDAYQEVLDAGASAAETLEALCWLLDQAGRSYRREIEILKGPTRMLSLGLGDHYRQGAEARYAMLVGLIDKGVASGELNDVAEPALVASCVREIMWSPMRHLAQISTARVRDFCRRAVLAGAAVGRDAYGKTEQGSA
jgi:AcrR family transcriptional regulator